MEFQRRAASMQSSESPSPLIGRDPRMARLRHEIVRVATTDFTVLIEGESGSGKELVARQVHEQSTRRGGPFVAVNCAAIVDTLVEAELFGIEDRTATGVRGRAGKFELANEGTVFLDEVADLSGAAQAKLLRAVQELAVERVGSHATRPLDVRLVVATNQRLRSMVETRRFRSDLFYRLSGVEILLVPPLRERRSDIPLLADHFLRQHRDESERCLAPCAMDALTAYDWPGNVRELRRVIEHVLAFSGARRIRGSGPAGDDNRGLRAKPAAVAVAGRHDAGMGKSLRANHARPLRQQQAGGMPRPGHQLPHAAVLSALWRRHDGQVDAAAGCEFAPVR